MNIPLPVCRTTPRRQFFGVVAALLLAASLFLFDRTPAVAQNWPVSYVHVAGDPFAAIPTADGKVIFVSITTHGQTGIAVLRQSGGQWSVDHVAPFRPGPSGMALTHDGKLLIATAGDYVIFFDTGKLLAGTPHPSIGWISDDKGAGSIYVAITPDDHFAFVSDESVNTITVIDVQRARTEGVSQSDVVGNIPVGIYPVALVFSPDGHTLFNTCELAPASFGWPVACKAQGQKSGPARETQGPLIVIDVLRAETDPANAVVARIPAGCRPVRLALSSDGNTAYVTARNSNTVNVIDLHSGQVGAVPVGAAPVGVVAIDGGKRLIVANSNRIFGSQSDSTLSVIDTSKVSTGAAAVVGTIPSGSFPRELKLMPDGKTLLVTNFNSDTVEFVDLSH
jgi:YVTN family beta-propeller protein